jgi:hypothetical protein
MLESINACDGSHATDFRFSMSGLAAKNPKNDILIKEELHHDL